MRWNRVTALVAAAVAVSTVAMSGCDAGDSSDYTTTEFKPDRHDPEPYREQIELNDGRRVAVWYDDRGLAEQHYSPDADAWTEPQLIHETETDPCQGIELVQSDGTVAVAADWGLYCYDGEPPFESVALTARGDLTEWDIHLTEGFDGWTGIEVNQNGDSVSWRGGGSELIWQEGDGFSGGFEPK